MYRLNLFYQKFLPAFLVAGVLLGIVFPQSAIFLKRTTLACLAILVFFPVLKMSGRVWSGRVGSQLGTWGVSLLVMFGLIPAAMYWLGRGAGLESELLAGLVLASAAPAMISSPYFAGLMNGNVGAAFSLSLLSTLLSPLVIPYILHVLVGESTTVSVPAVAQTIVVVIAAPAAVAIVARRTAPRITTAIVGAESVFTVSAIVLINWVIVGTNRGAIVDSAAVVLLPLLALALFQDFGVFFLTRKVSSYFVSHDVSRSLAVSFGLKNVALVGGIMVGFSEPMALASSVVSLVHVLMFVTISVWRDRL